MPYLNHDMAIRFTFIIFLMLISQAVVAGEIVLSGVYQGKNLFLRNPYIPDQKKFCVSQIFVNNIPLSNLPRSSALQISLDHLKHNDEVSIRIIHLDGCTPVVVNPEVIQQARDFEFLFTQVDDNSINWITTGETPEGVFELEKLKWVGWVKVREIQAKGELDNNQYSIEAGHYSGDNSYRLIYKNNKGASFSGEEVSFYSLLEPIIMYPGQEIFEWISLSRDTDWEIYNDYDSLQLKGYGGEINVKNLDYGDYYIIIEDEPLRFFRPEPEIIPRKKRKKTNKDNKVKE
jgi:hypothetical protein